jgi:glucose/arabinose dehydrogenase
MRGCIAGERKMRNAVLIFATFAVLAGCAENKNDSASSAPEAASPNAAAPVDAVSGASAPAAGGDQVIRFESAGMQLELEELLRTDDAVFAMEFIGPNTMIFSERRGQLKLLQLDSGEISEISGEPQVMQPETGGVFDVHVDPDFSENHFLYFSYVKEIGDESAITLARARLDNLELTGLTDLFVANNGSDDHAHWGSRVIMDSNRYLYMTVGDRHVPNNAQDPASHGGKVLRFNEDGSVPDDNPYVDVEGAAPEIWTIGHRNPQGLAFHPESGKLFEQEHGPAGGDEVNIIEPGLNYGWPVITWGEDIWGGQLPEGTEREGLEQPFRYFKPGIAPSGLNFYNGERLTGWTGNLFNSTLRGHLTRLELDGEQVVSEERLLQEWGERLRDVVEGPDGFLYLATETGAIARIVPTQQ